MQEKNLITPFPDVAPPNNNKCLRLRLWADLVKDLLLQFSEIVPDTFIVCRRNFRKLPRHVFDVIGKSRAAALEVPARSAAPIKGLFHSGKETSNEKEGRRDGRTDGRTDSQTYNTKKVLSRKVGMLSQDCPSRIPQFCNLTSSLCLHAKDEITVPLQISTLVITYNSFTRWQCLWLWHICHICLMNSCIWNALYKIWLIKAVQWT